MLKNYMIKYTNLLYKYSQRKNITRKYNYRIKQYNIKDNKIGDFIFLKN